MQKHAHLNTQKSPQKSPKRKPQDIHKELVSGKTKAINKQTHKKPNYYNTKNLGNLLSSFCVDLSTTRDVACAEWFVCPVFPFEKSNILLVKLEQI